MVNLVEGMKVESLYHNTHWRKMELLYQIGLLLELISYLDCEDC